jgi:hypothetical protein
LSSKRDVSFEQARDMFQVLGELCDAHPMIKIIIGIDANHFIGSCRTIFMNYAPKNKDEATTLKQRTYLQTQVGKAGEMVRECKDFILTNMEFKGYVICNINRIEANDSDLLPSDKHPYDHFIVSAEF